MLRIATYVAVALFVFTQGLSAQSAAINYIDFLDSEKDQAIYIDSSEIMLNKIPTCEEPQSVAISDKGNDILVTWDNENHDEFEVEYGTSVNIEERTKTSTRSGKLTLNSTSRSDLYMVRVRRVCNDYGQSLHSEWVDVIGTSSQTNPCANQDECEKIRNYIEYRNVRVNSGTSQRRKRLLIRFPAEYESVKFDYQRSGANPKTGQITEWNYSNIKKVRISGGFYLRIDIPYEVQWTRLKNIRVKKYLGSEYVCSDVYLPTPDEQECNEQLMFSVKNIGSKNRYSFSYYSSNSYDNAVITTASNQTVQSIPLVKCPLDLRVKHTGTFETCDDFTFSTGCSSTYIDNDCNDVEASCEDLSYVTSSSPFEYKTETGEKASLCFLQWNFSKEIDGFITEKGGGKSYRVKGQGGSLLLKKGEYILSFKYQDSSGSSIDCGQTITIECENGIQPPFTSEEIDELIPCKAFNFDVGHSTVFDQEIIACGFSWQVPDSLDAIVTFTHEETGEKFVTSENNGEVPLTEEKWIIVYTLIYDHPEHGLIANECAGFTVQCGANLTQVSYDTGSDIDRDGILDQDDNCISTPNPTQADTDNDGIGDACEPDTDNDGIIDDNDNCPYIVNPNQEDWNQDGIGDVCDNGNNDADDDGIPDDIDNCPTVANFDQLDTDEDGIGDVCETDTDGDGVIDDEDNCWLVENPQQEDENQNGIGDICEDDSSEEPDVISLEPVFLCEYFSSFKAELINSSTVMMTYSKNENYHELDQARLAQQLMLIGKISIELSYENEEGQGNQNQTLFDKNIDGGLTEQKFLQLSAIFQSSSVFRTEMEYRISFETIAEEPYSCSSNRIIASEEEEPEDIDDSIPEIPDLDCGEEFDSPKDENTAELDNLKVGETIYMNGFPLIVSELTSEKSPFSGIAVVPMPFGDNKLLKVNFQNLGIRDNHVVHSGQIELKATGDQLANINVVNVPVLSVGDNYCKPPQTVDSGSGEPGDGDDTSSGGSFDENGNHTGTGTPYDWNGFDVNGNHYTGYDHNEYGCKADGTHHQTGEECDPSQPYSEIEGIINDLEPVLDDKILDAVTNLLAALNIDVNNLNCDSKRADLNTAMETFLQGKSQEEQKSIRQAIFGAGDEYLNDGLSTHFASAPTLPADDNIRDPKIKDIESKHVELYLCDENKERFTNYSEALNDEETKAKIKAFIIAEISTWTEYEVKELFSPSNEEKFGPWLAAMIDKYFKQNSPNADTGYIDEYLQPEDKLIIEEKLYEAFDFRGSSFFSTASAEYMDVDINGQQREAFDFEFDQGFKEVLGINRAFFLEKISEINGDASGLMPMRVPTPMNGKTVDIYLDDLKISPSSTTVDVYAIIETANGKLVVQADDVTITSSGIESASLKLLSPIELKLFNPAKILIHPEGTSIDWACGGLENFNLAASVEICDQYIKPYNLETKQVLNGNVTFDITASGSGWMEFTTTINGSHPFVVTKYESWAFELKTLVIDTDSETTPDFTPMIGYESNFLVGNSTDNIPDKLGPGWTGMYLEKLLIDIPDKLSSGGALEAISFENCLFDDQGATGQVNIHTELLSLEDGNAGGWGFSIEKFSLAVMQNNISGFGLDGQIQTPLFDEPMTYVGSMHTNDTYSLVVKADLEKKRNVPLFLAEAELSAFEITAISAPEFSEMQLSATVTGTLEVKGAAITNKLANLPKMQFTDLTIRNFGEKRLDVEKWELIFPSNPSPIKLFGMDLAFGNQGSSSFAVKTNYADHPNKVGIPMNVTINYLEDIGVVIAGGFDIVGELDKGEPLHKWKYTGIELTQFCADVTTSAVRMNACLSWFDDVNHGKGFRGEGFMELDLPPLEIRVDVITEFGTKAGEKYFFLDALARFDPIAVAPPLGISGFGGGVSYGMKSEFIANASSFSNIVNSDGGLGSTFSGATYTPNADSGLSIKALTLFELTNVSAIFNGSAFLNVNLDKSGSLNDIQFGGVANMMSEINLSSIPVLDKAQEKLDLIKNAQIAGQLTSALNTLTKKPIAAKVSGYVFMKLDLVNEIFTGDMKVFMNFGSILRGKGEDGALVHAKFRFKSPKDWFVNIGTPQNLCGIEMDLGLADAERFSYFDVGTTIPSFTTDHLSPKIRSFVEQNVQISEAFRKSGGGIMFGMGFNVNIHASIWIGSFDVSCGAGFDVMLRKTDASCIGRSGKVGLDGWYAMGQVYAYVDAGLTIAGVEVLGVGLYVVMNAQFPDPTYMQAAVRIRLKLLFVSVDKTMKLEIGEKCDLAYDDPNDAIGMEAITLLLPFDGAEEVLTDNDLEVNYALSLDELLEVGEDQEYLVTDASHVLVDSSGNSVPVIATMNEDNTIATLRPTDLLAGDMTYTLTTTIDIVVHENGSEVDRVTQEKTTVFTTSEAYTDVPFTNIEYAYPVPGMYNFYLKEKIDHDTDNGLASMINNGGMHSEVTKCYVKLAKGQQNLIEQFDEGYSKVVALYSLDQPTIYRSFEYNYLTREILYSLPTSMPRGETYTLQIQLMPNRKIQELLDEGAALPPSISSIDINEEFLGHSQVDEDQTSSKNQTLILLSYSFRVSEFDSFTKKMQSTTSSTQPSGQHVEFLLNMNGSHLDIAEMYGIDAWEPLVNFSLEDSRWAQVYEELFEPFGRIYDTDIANESIRSSYNQASYLQPFSVSGVNPESLFVVDLTSTTASGGQSLKIPHDAQAASLHHNYINSIEQVFYPFISQYGAQCGSIDYSNPNSINDYINCVQDNTSGTEYYFIDTYRDLLDHEYPKWNTTPSAKTTIDMKYTLPNGDTGSSYRKVFTPGNN